MHAGARSAPNPSSRKRHSDEPRQNLCLLAALVLAASSFCFAQQANEGKTDEPKTDAPVRKITRVRVSQGVLRTRKRVPPSYPLEARSRGIQGQVVMHILVSREGEVNEVDVIRGDKLLAPAAVDAVKQWKYKPYTLNGEAVEVDTEVLINFSLEQ